MPKGKLGFIHVNLSSKAGTRIENVFFNWAITGGKIVIIVTELIALSALGYRFVIDRQIVDLHDQITRENILLTGQASKEQDYRNIQTRLAQIKSITDATKSKINIMNTILSTLNSGDFSSVNLSLNLNEFSIDGYAPTVLTINDFINTLKQYPNIDSISLNDVESSDLGIKFQLTIDLKNNGNVQN